ncbi:hypothetical protein WDZ17_10185 [Pseudokineococcus basanitobsidens]|uniref:Uncharacterized protein n=1 Tax=Pseudokineococcus basanitobsidens TaxID=1926649 RepID=A0ABU8RKU5_9ACTN
MKQSGDGCGCAQEYAARWPGMSAGELALVHDPECPVRLRRVQPRRRRPAPAPRPGR